MYRVKPVINPTTLILYFKSDFDEAHFLYVPYETYCMHLSNRFDLAGFWDKNGYLGFVKIYGIVLSAIWKFH